MDFAVKRKKVDPTFILHLLGGMEVLSIVCKHLPILLLNKDHKRSSCAVTQLLITAGCDVNWSNSCGETALHMAVANACIHCAELICVSAGDNCAALVNAHDNDGIAPIHTAAQLDDDHASSMIGANMVRAQVSRRIRSILPKQHCITACVAVHVQQPRGF